ncbi:response regulator [Nostocaceae cyanobacterium CENA369]|uniref:Response regulator n=1 Tax=Dendronalium phyllosphericum CENA369 TaxID=1725256 RepID=A0A8J7I2G9_9NOST|nr:response regulator [Dendronalium phyllosphericum]MBH8574486.1 response regulator [Dendronalium phyllosphericum CENA369]
MYNSDCYIHSNIDISTQKNSNSKYILICDDIVENCILFKIYLEIAGYQVEIVTNGVAALAKIKSKVPDLLILDVMMPAMDGYEVARRIRHDPDLGYFPILLVTASDEADVKNNCEVIVDGVLQKPCAPNVLLSMIKIILESK